MILLFETPKSPQIGFNPAHCILFNFQPGTHCGPDDDADGWPDEALDCPEPLCAQVDQ